MKLKKLASLALAGALTLGLLPAFSSPALAGVVTTTDYVLTIPSSLSVTKSGWNEQTDGITAKLSSGDAFDDSKKLTVTAASNNKDTNAEYEWKLVSDTNTVGYNLAASGDDSSSYNSTATPASWEFSASEITTTGTKKTLGIIVEDYSTKPAGTYTDTVTFTAKVETARQLHSFTLTGPYTHQSLVVEFYDGDKWSDMVAKYSLITNPSREYVGFSSDGFITKNGSWVKMTDTVDPNATYYVE